MKYSVILGNLGNTCDRFLSSGYKNNLPTEEMFRQAVSIEGVEGIELVGSWDITAKNVVSMGKLLLDHNIKLVSIIPDHFGQAVWGRGAFTSRDPKVRKQAVDVTKEMIDILDELGGELINIWPGQDGYDYPFQGNFDEANSWLVEGIKECADYKPDVKIALEYKPKEPRNFSYLARSSDTLLTALETGCENVGVTIDVGHAFVGGENVSESIYRLMKAGKLYHMHFNDNYKSWDDDMIVGSIHTVEFVEILYWLEKTGYDGWYSMDQYPYREDGRDALNESIQWLDALRSRMEIYGLEKIEELIKAGSATDIVRELRRLILS
ncbi:MAG: sugar phosphate isomerase/epimerase [Spirochaetales bacterium]|nr:sugar phosphate isomerase/epimerase [Spirochaetales bacterium]